jgi:hypothetical protein
VIPGPNIEKLDYERHSVDEPVAPEVQFRQLLPPLVFIVIGLSIYALRALWGVRGWSPARFMMYVLMAAFIQTAIGVVGGVRRGYLLPKSCFSTWLAAAKLAACVIFCGAFGIYGNDLSFLTVFLFPSLIKWTFETDDFEAGGFTIICCVVQIALFFMLI